MENNLEKEEFLEQIEQEIYLKQLQYEGRYNISEGKKAILIDTIELLLEVNSGFLCEGEFEEICIEPEQANAEVRMIADSFDISTALIPRFAALLKRVQSFRIEEIDEEWLRIIVCLDSIWKDK